MKRSKFLKSLIAIPVIGKIVSSISKEELVYADMEKWKDAKGIIETCGVIEVYLDGRPIGIGKDTTLKIN